MNRDELVEALCDRLRRHYVWADKVDAMCGALRASMPEDLEGHAMAAWLTERLQSVAPDRHLRVRWFDRMAADTRTEDNEVAARRRRDEAQADHWGLMRVERLDDGRIGLVEISQFCPAAWIDQPLAESMTALDGVSALVFDLRRCRGGEPDGVARVASHLFGAEPVHLNDLFLRVEDRIESFWTRPEAPGPRFADAPVFVLVSSATFSAAEEFAYDLQALRRGVVVGEITRGGANPGQIHRLDDHFAVFIPDARAINPVTGDNWEGCGVQPDVICPAEGALELATRLAREALSR
jgi:C-terminal processing protease CtpA/Prc